MSSPSLGEETASGGKVDEIGLDQLVGELVIFVAVVGMAVESGRGGVVDTYGRRHAGAETLFMRPDADAVYGIVVGIDADGVVISLDAR